MYCATFNFVHFCKFMGGLTPRLLLLGTLIIFNILENLLLTMRCNTLQFDREIVNIRKTITEHSY
jgi:hypothetical protein